jgi:hypothetical protein
MTDTTKIIEFPSSKIVRPQVVENQAIQHIQTKGMIYLAENISAEIVAGIFNDLASAGIDTETAQFNNDFNFISLSVTAIVHRALGLDHGFIPVIDQVKIVETSGPLAPKTQ